MKDTLLTIPQENIWNLYKYYNITAIANICGAFFSPYKFEDLSLVEKAINMVLQNQTGLRLRFVEQRDGVHQYVAEYQEESIPVVNFDGMDEFHTFANEQAKKPIRIEEGKQYRFYICCVGERTGILCILSHLIADAWSMSLIINGIWKAYQQLISNETVSLTMGDYMEYVEWSQNYRRSEKYEKDCAFWEKMLETKPEMASVRTESGSTDRIESGRITRKVDGELSKKIYVFSNQTGFSPAVVYEAAIFLYLHRINPSIKRLTIGIPVLNRATQKEKNTCGMFISTMPLMVEVEDEDTIVGLLAKITNAHRAVFRHERFPYNDILKMTREKYALEGGLYECMFSYQNASLNEDVEGETFWYSNGYSEIPLGIHIDDRDNSNADSLTIDYQTNVFKDNVEISLLWDRMEYIIHQIVDTSENDRQISNIDILVKKERKLLLETFNNTYVDYPREKCVHELFTEQAERTPDKTALIFEEQKFTYRQLDEMSNALAHVLREKGIGRGDIVPLIAHRSWHVIVAMLGVLKAGGVYMPLSPDYPLERIKTILNMAKSRIALCFGYDEDLPIICLDLSKIDYESKTNPVKNVNNLDDLCYLIFTSGSTGKPNGVLQTHKCIINLTSEQIQKKNPKDKNIFAMTTITFDVSVQEILYALLGEGILYFSDDNMKMTLSKCLLFIKDKTIDVTYMTPSYLNMLYTGTSKSEYAESSIEEIILAGENIKIAEEIIRKSINKICYINQYGPSETHVATEKILTSCDNLSIGRPIANTQIYILDEKERLCPIGIAGELCIAGDGVGAGYLNRPELTAEKFVPNPFATQENGHGKIMYKTGDLARWRVDGEIEYLGRIDTQIKIRGLRVELGEIESVMASFPGIQLVAATDKKDESGRQYLVGYYTAETEIDEKELRETLRSKLPKYMVPNYFVHIKEMPMTASGKTDRKNLPVPDWSDLKDEQDYVAPITSTEERLSKIWGELLHIQKIGREDDFFELGGDSLLAISMVREIEVQLNKKVKMSDVLENTILWKLASVIGIEKESVQKISIPRINSQRYELTYQQMAIYAECEKDPETLRYNMPAKIKLPADADREKLKNAIRQVYENHGALKTYIENVDGKVYGVIDKNAEPIFEMYENHDTGRFLRPFDLAKAPLVRIGFSEDELLFDAHHIISDGTSLKIILTEIFDIYQGKELMPEIVEYSDYAEYYRRVDFEEHNNYFKQMLKCDFEPITLPETRNAEKTGSTKSYQMGEESDSVGEVLKKRYHLTDTMLYLGAYAILLSKYSAKTDVLTSMVCTNRLNSEVERTVGMFVNTLPLYLSARGEVKEYFEQVKKVVTGIYQYQDIPFLEIAEAVGMQDKTVVNTSFVYQAEGVQKLILGEERLAPDVMDTKTSKFDLMMEVIPSESGHTIRFEWRADKYDEVLIDSLMKAYRKVFAELLKTTIEDVDLVSAEDKEKQLVTFNDTIVEYRKEKCVHELFMEQVKKHPDRIALVFEDKKFTYRQLDEMSNSLAHKLVKNEGVCEKDIIAVISHRSWHFIVATLGILKAGGAFMPIGTDLPMERIKYMLETANVKCALVYSFDEKLPIDQIDLSDIDYNEDVGCLPNVCKSEDYCYVLFTSGTTGKPKGVVITHHNLANFVDYNKLNHYQYSIIHGGSCVLADTIFTFDISVFEIYLALLNGLKVVLSREFSTAGELAGLIETHNVDVFHTTPTKLKILMEDELFRQSMKHIKYIMCGAECFTEQLFEEIHKHTTAVVFNGYGPTETTIGSCFKEVKKDITIGKPIANTQIYILDTNQHLLPLGVAGELCIAGDGVGAGYLNRPELTAERFVPNPFATIENGHGKIMYKTGDLAHWRADGEIEYLGRIDTQIKIRGLRVELGEIESVMASFPGVQLVAATDKKDEIGRQYLVGYYTAEMEIDEKELREVLRSKLPKYMVPNYFMHIKEMPMTASGKTDRKNLPLPEFKSLEEESGYVPPETTLQEQLCDILKKVFGSKRYGLDDDFFDMGGDSLRAIEFTSKSREIGISFPLQSVFDYPTVRALSLYLEGAEGKKVTYAKEDFDKYQELLRKNKMDEQYVPVEKTLGNVLLTGATGFLGAHILDELMKNTTETVYCLVRSSEPDDRRGRICELLEYYFGDTYEQEIGKRIIPVVGDIEKEGLSEQLPDTIRTVIHAAATVKHYGTYEYFDRVNVQGTRHVAEFAKKCNARLIHISTLSVSGNSFADAFKVYRAEEEVHFDETSLYIDQPLDNVYIHSKFEAERVVLDAALEGLDVKIIRVGNLTNRASDLKFQKNYESNAFLTRVKAALELGVIPDYLLPLYAEFSPIDLTAKGVVLIARYASADHTVFHLNSNRPLYFDKMIQYLKQIGIPMKAVTAKEFGQKLQESLSDNGRRYIYEAFQNDMDADGKLVYDTNIRIENDLTIRFLEKLGFSWNEIDEKYVKEYVDYFIKIGYFTKTRDDKEMIK